MRDENAYGADNEGDNTPRQGSHVGLVPSLLIPPPYHRHLARKQHRQACPRLIFMARAAACAASSTTTATTFALDCCRRRLDCGCAEGGGTPGLGDWIMLSVSICRAHLLANQTLPSLLHQPGKMSPCVDRAPASIGREEWASEMGERLRNLLDTKNTVLVVIAGVQNKGRPHLPCRLPSVLATMMHHKPPPSPSLQDLLAVFLSLAGC